MPEQKEMPATREGKLDHYLEARYAQQVSANPDRAYMAWLDKLIHLYSADLTAEEFNEKGRALYEWARNRKSAR